MSIGWRDLLKVGSFTLPNRIVMATMTRERCDIKLNIPTPLVAEYYAQRTGAGLILTEGAAWSPRGISALGAGCLFN
jgi:2,4-dienoyl-CoA reductase-like NADH-dependent reductase (Old Yellow Enzyme family)